MIKTFLVFLLFSLFIFSQGNNNAYQIEVKTSKKINNKIYEAEIKAPKKINIFTYQYAFTSNQKILSGTLKYQHVQGSSQSNNKHWHHKL